MKNRHRIHTAAACAAGLLVLLQVCPARAGDEAERLTQLADTLEANCRAKHEAMQQAQKSWGKPMWEQERVMQDMQRNIECECLPARVRAAIPQLSRAMQANKKDEFDAILFAQTKNCHVVGYRQYVGRLCEVEPGAAKKTCECVAAGTDKLDDETVFSEIMASYKNFEQRVKDKTVPKYEGRMSAIEKACGMGK